MKMENTLKLLLLLQVPPAVSSAGGGRRVCDSRQATVIPLSDNNIIIIITRYLLLLKLFLVNYIDHFLIQQRISFNLTSYTDLELKGLNFSRKDSFL